MDIEQWSHRNPAAYRADDRQRELEHIANCLALGWARGLAPYGDGPHRLPLLLDAHALRVLQDAVETELPADYIADWTSYMSNSYTLDRTAEKVATDVEKWAREMAARLVRRRPRKAERWLICGDGLGVLREEDTLAQAKIWCIAYRADTDVEPPEGAVKGKLKKGADGTYRFVVPGSPELTLVTAGLAPQVGVDVKQDPIYAVGAYYPLKPNQRVLDDRNRDVLS